MTSRLTRLARFLPGPADAIFGFVLGLLLLGGRHGLLNDPGTPWHLRLGREIIATGSVPRSDTLTFTRDGTPWVDQSWAFDVLLALVVDHWGWSAAIALASLGLAWLYRTMARDMIRDGTSPVIAAVVSVFAVCIGAIHFLLRPHLFTFAFVYLTLRACQAQHQRGGWAVLQGDDLHVDSRQPAWRLRRAAGDRGHRGARTRPLRCVGRDAKTEHGQIRAGFPGFLPGGTRQSLWNRRSTVTWRACSSRAA